MNDRDPKFRISGIIAMNCYLRSSDGSWYRRNADFTVAEPVEEALIARGLEDEDDQVRAAELPKPRAGWAKKMARRVVPLLMRDLGAAVPTRRVDRPSSGRIRPRGRPRPARPPASADDTACAGALQFAAQKAVEAIDKLSRKFHDVTLPELIANLGDADPEIRELAAEELAGHGSRAKAAGPALAGRR